MKFFVPAASSPEEAENVLVGRDVPLLGKRIFRLEYKHKGKHYVAEVSQPIASWTT
jgi:hypothetical protein